jgi:hypothetical protein
MYYVSIRYFTLCGYILNATNWPWVCCRECSKRSQSMPILRSGWVYIAYKHNAHIGVLMWVAIIVVCMCFMNSCMAQNCPGETLTGASTGLCHSAASLPSACPTRAGFVLVDVQGSAPYAMSICTTQYTVNKCGYIPCTSACGIGTYQAAGCTTPDGQLSAATISSIYTGWYFIGNTCASAGLSTCQNCVPGECIYGVYLSIY